MRLRPPPRKPDLLEKLLSQPEFDGIPLSVVAHCQAVPLGLLVRGILEWLLDDQALEQILRDHAPEQYTRELTISALVKLLIQVSAGSRASVFAAFQADQDLPKPSITTSYQALYGKLGRIQPAVSAALVRHSADRLGLLLHRLP